MKNPEPAILTSTDVLTREDWDFPFGALHGLDDTMLRAKLLWEMGRHLEIDPLSGASISTTATLQEPFTAFSPLGTLGDKFSTHFPGNHLAVLAIEQTFLRNQRDNTESSSVETEPIDQKIRIRRKISPWIPCNYPAWDSITAEERTRFIRLAWPPPLEAFDIKSEHDVDVVASILKAHLRAFQRTPKSRVASKYAATVLIRSHLWTMYHRDMIAPLAAIRLAEAAETIGTQAAAGVPRGLTSRQFAARLEDLALLRLVLAYGRVRAQAEVLKSQHDNLQKFEKAAWSEDWAKRCRRSINFFRSLFPSNRSIGVLADRRTQMSA